MAIDTNRKHKITNYKHGDKTTEADHVPMTLKMNIKITLEKPDKVEILNFKDQSAMKKFRENITNTKDFSQCIESKLPFNKKINNWKHLLEQHCKNEFPTIRIRRNNLKPEPTDSIINKRNELLKHTTEDASEDLRNLDVSIASMIAVQERIKCHKLKKFCDQNGSINMTEIWKMKKKLCPSKPSSLTQAKIYHQGKLVSFCRDVKLALLKEYKERLKSRPKHPMIKKLYKSKTLNYKLVIAKGNKSKPISLTELDFVLSKTKRGKA